MANVCIMRHESYLKSDAHRPYCNNMGKAKNYSNDNIDLSHTKFNSVIVDNLHQGETYLKAFSRLYKKWSFYRTTKSERG